VIVRKWLVRLMFVAIFLGLPGYDLVHSLDRHQEYRATEARTAARAEASRRVREGTPEPTPLAVPAGLLERTLPVRELEVAYDFGGLWLHGGRMYGGSQDAAAMRVGPLRSSVAALGLEALWLRGCCETSPARVTLRLVAEQPRWRGAGEWDAVSDVDLPAPAGRIVARANGAEEPVAVVRLAAGRYRARVARKGELREQRFQVDLWPVARARELLVRTPTRSRR
jgi:hypothetical protein